MGGYLPRVLIEKGSLRWRSHLLITLRASRVRITLNDLNEMLGIERKELRLLFLCSGDIDLLENVFWCKHFVFVDDREFYFVFITYKVFRRVTYHIT